MIYKQELMEGSLSKFIKSIWVVDSEDSKETDQQKIIPDGYPEIIFHYRDPYKVNLNDKWETQSLNLLSGQITKFFYLENTGFSGMIGIKLQPWTIKELFKVSMNKLTDQIIPLNKDLVKELNPIKKISIANRTVEEKLNTIQEWLYEYIKDKNIKNTKGQNAVEHIISKHGLLSIQELQALSNMNERALQRYFKSYIGVSPKFYCRIIRLSYVFNLVNQIGFDSSDLTFLAGFYDQSHFIKNFKEFTGEEPSNYGFNKTNMANLFLK